MFHSCAPSSRPSIGPSASMVGFHRLGHVRPGPTVKAICRITLPSGRGVAAATWSLISSLYERVSYDAEVFTRKERAPPGSGTLTADPTVTCDSAACRLTAQAETNCRPVRLASTG